MTLEISRNQLAWIVALEAFNEPIRQIWIVLSANTNQALVITSGLYKGAIRPAEALRGGEREAPQGRTRSVFKRKAAELHFGQRKGGFWTEGFKVKQY